MGNQKYNSARSVSKCAWVILFVLSAVFICLIEFTEGNRLIYLFKNGEKLNEIFLPIWYSIFASCVFYLITTYWPEKQKMKNERVITERSFRAIYESMRRCVTKVYVSFDCAPPKKDEFFKAFRERFFFKAGFCTGTKTLIESYDAERIEIRNIINQLLTHKYLEAEDIKAIARVSESEFINYGIHPRLTDDPYVDDWSNQDKICEEIWELYQTIAEYLRFNYPNKGHLTSENINDEMK